MIYLGSVTFDRFVQPSNVELPRVMTELGMTISLRLVQFINEPLISVTELPKDTFVRLVQLSNARLPIATAASLMIKVVRPVHPLNASSEILVTELGMIISLRLVHPLKPPILVTELGKVISLRLVHPLKALIEVIELGRVTFTKFVQSENAKRPISVMELGRFNSEMIVDENAFSPISVTELGRSNSDMFVFENA